MTSPLLEVLVLETGDRAEAETPEGALLAARTLVRDARENGCGVRPTVYFLVDGQLVAIRKGAF